MLYVKKKIIKLINELVSFFFIRSYTIYDYDENDYRVVKILNIYSDKKEAQKNLISLVTNNTSEFKLLKDFNKKQLNNYINQ